MDERILHTKLGLSIPAQKLLGETHSARRWKARFQRVVRKWI